MPQTWKPSLAEARSEYTGEEPHQARKGVGRRAGRIEQLGMDSCSDGQRRFRAQLAVHIFNCGTPIGLPGIGDVASTFDFLSYTMTVSPRFDLIQFAIPGAVENAVGRLTAPLGQLEFAVPGLRLAAAAFQHTYYMIHIPTGAHVVFSKHSHFYSQEEIVAKGEPLRRHIDSFVPLGVPLQAAEERQLAATPPMTADAEVLLAGLVARIDVEDPGGDWATGGWWTDRLRREPPAGYRLVGPTYLWGSGAQWVLRWSGHPYPVDIIGCLTDPRFGIRGAHASGTGNNRVIRLGDASLSLEYGRV